MDGDLGQLDVAVIGAGRMGQLHARTYQKITQANLLAVVDPDSQRAGDTAAECHCQAYSCVNDLFEKHPTLGAVSIAVPTAQHVPVTQAFITRGIACLVEKPLAPTAKEAQALADLADEHRVVLQVGHTERFNPAIRALSAMAIQPRFMEVHRISPMTFRSLDVGVVMDMMIHDLDIMLMLASSPLQRVDATGVAVIGPHEDVANARLLFESGCVANVTASRLAFKTERKLRIFSEDAYVSLDYARRDGIVIRKSENADMLGQLREQLAQGMDLADVDYSDLVHVDELTMDLVGDGAHTDPLTTQLMQFLKAVREGGPPAVDAHAGYAAVDAAERVVQAIQSHQWQGLATTPLSGVSPMSGQPK